MARPTTLRTKKAKQAPVPPGGESTTKQQKDADNMNRRSQLLENSSMKGMQCPQLTHFPFLFN